LRDRWRSLAIGEAKPRRSPHILFSKLPLSSAIDGAALSKVNI
jgi:hypothetical protein